MFRYVVQKRFLTRCFKSSLDATCWVHHLRHDEHRPARAWHSTPCRGCGRVLGGSFAIPPKVLKSLESILLCNWICPYIFSIHRNWRTLRSMWTGPTWSRTLSQRSSGQRLRWKLCNPVDHSSPLGMFLRDHASPSLFDHWVGSLAADTLEVEYLRSGSLKADLSSWKSGGPKNNDFLVNDIELQRSVKSWCSFKRTQWQGACMLLWASPTKKPSNHHPKCWTSMLTICSCTYSPWLHINLFQNKHVYNIYI